MDHERKRSADQNMEDATEPAHKKQITESQQDTKSQKEILVELVFERDKARINAGLSFDLMQDEMVKLQELAKKLGKIECPHAGTVAEGAAARAEEEIQDHLRHGKHVLTCIALYFQKVAEYRQAGFKAQSQFLPHESASSGKGYNKIPVYETGDTERW